MPIEASGSDNIGCDLGGVGGWIVWLSQAMEALAKYDIVISHLELVCSKWVVFQPLEEFGQPALELYWSR